MRFLPLRVAITILLLLALSPFSANLPAEEQLHSRGATFAERLEQLRQEHQLVSLAAIVTVEGQMMEAAAVGERKVGSGISVDVTDRWHLGSITKSITATMIARLVEAGELAWDDTIANSFPDTAIHNDWKPVTIRQLLTHTAGAPKNFPLRIRVKQPAAGEETVAARREAVLEILAEEPAHSPGSRMSYSNVGYAIAGAIAEQATGNSWNELVRREVFEPLKLTDSGFGPPQLSAEAIDQPVGHRTALLLKIAMDDKADNTPIMAPGGGVHMSLQDLTDFANAHLRGASGADDLLSPQSWEQLHTPELGNYACGWLKQEPDANIPHTLYWHNGSNTMWYALVVFIPETNMTVAVTSNDGDIKNAEAAAWKVVNASAKD